MKRKWISILLGLAVIAVMGMTVPTAAAENSESATETEAVVEKAADIKLEVNGAEMTVVNETETEVTSAQVEEEKEGTYKIILTTEDGEHTFEGTAADKWAEPKLIEDHGFFYIRYVWEDGSSRDAAETGEAVTFDEALTMWAVANVNMRAEANGDSQIVRTVGLGDECKVTAGLPGWYEVEYNGETGYINHKYISENKDDADAAVQREKAAQEAAAAQSSSYSYSSSNSGSGNSGGGSSSGNNGGGNGGQCLDNGLLN